MKGQKLINFLIAYSHPFKGIQIEKMDQEDISRYVEMCEPLLNATKHLKSEELYPERVDDVIEKKKRRNRNVTPIPPSIRNYILTSGESVDFIHKKYKIPRSSILRIRRNAINAGKTL